MWVTLCDQCDHIDQPWINIQHWWSGWTEWSKENITMIKTDVIKIHHWPMRIKTTEDEDDTFVKTTSQENSSKLSKMRYFSQKLCYLVNIVTFYQKCEFLNWNLDLTVQKWVKIRTNSKFCQHWDYCIYMYQSVTNIFEYSNIRVYWSRIYIRTFVRINFSFTNIFGHSFVSNFLIRIYSDIRL